MCGSTGHATGLRALLSRRSARSLAAAGLLLLVGLVVWTVTCRGESPAARPVRSERDASVAAPAGREGGLRSPPRRRPTEPTHPRAPSEGEQLEKRTLYRHVSLLTCQVEGVVDAEARFESPDALVAGTSRETRGWTSGPVSIRSGAAEIFVFAPDGVGELMIPGVGAVTVAWRDLADGAGGLCATRLSPSDGATIHGRVVGLEGDGPWSLTMCDKTVNLDAAGRFVGPAAPGCMATVRWMRGNWSVSSPPAVVPAGATGAVFELDGAGYDLVLVDDSTSRLLARRHSDGIEVVGDPSGRWGRGDVIESVGGVACADFGCLEELESALQAGEAAQVSIHAPPDSRGP